MTRNTNATANVVQLPVQPHTFRFVLRPEVKGAYINCDIVFPGNPVLAKRNRKKIGLPTATNCYMNNEIRYYIQHLIYEEKVAPSYLQGLITNGLSIITRFFNECLPDCNSIAELDYEDAYKQYTAYLLSQGRKVIFKQKVAQVDKNLNQIETYVHSQPVYTFNRFFRYINELCFPDITEEREKDRWDLHKIGIPINNMNARPRWTVSFEKLHQPWLRELAKSYEYFRLPSKAVSTILDDLKGIRNLSDFLYKERPHLSNLTQLTRLDIEDFIGFVHQKGYVTTTFNRRLGAVKTFFEIGNMLDFDNFPTKQLLFDSDFEKVEHQLLRAFTDTELKSLNEHIDDLPIQHSRIFFVMENCGMRLSDLCCAEIYVNKEYCLKEINSGFLFTYPMPKVHRTNSVPVDELVKNVIEEAIQHSREQFGSDVKYVFAQDVDRPISVETFCRYMNLMTQRHGLKYDDGTPLRVKGHTFRRTVATNYANSGVSPDVIRMMLGQKSLGVLFQHYITIHGEKMANELLGITTTNNALIENIGHVDDTIVKEAAESNFLALPNGSCGRSVALGICEHANACLTCRMFHPSREYLPMYKQQLLTTEQNIAYAQLRGYERILEANLKTKESLQAIIKTLEGDADGEKR